MTHINGRNAVIEALRAGQPIEKVFIAYGLEGEAIARVRAEAKRAGVPAVVIDKRRFTELERSAGLGTRSQGVIGLLSPIDYVDIDALVDATFARGAVPLVAVLDGITDPHNVGAIIRSAECAGFDAVVLGRTDSSSITDVVVKTSAGAVTHLPIARVPNLVDTLTSLRDAGLFVVGLDERGESMYTLDGLDRPLAVVIGSEGKGLSPRVRRLCETVVAIPMYGNIPSLNASVAAGISFFEVRRRRGDARTGQPSEDV